MLSACSYVYADKFTACDQNLPNACMRRNVSSVHVRRSARPSWCPSEFQKSAAQSCFFCRTGGENKQCLYYRDVLLTQKLLPVIRQIMSSCFSRTVLQHTMLVRLELLRRERTGLYFTGTVATEQSRS